MSQTVSGAPVVTGPASASVKINSSVALPCKATIGTPRATLQVAVAVGTVAASVGGKPVVGSGTKSIVYTDTAANVQAALASLVYTG